ncbi:MAG: sigma-70 family RNA polymerase sigma factor [Sandaracinaceae bacterium]|nr:sigma-70 family RNA polymerase sigma factor [Sandaracinaceae bacterium]
MTQSPSGAAPFPTTRCSAIAALRSDDAEERRRSWDAVVTAYWRPVYKYVRTRRRASREDAEDLVQAFFARALEKDFFDGYDPERARFRTFLRTCVDRFASNAHKAARRQKRGGGAAALSLDFDGAEDELARVGAATSQSPEDLFDREWRRALFTLAVEALRAECDAKGKPVIFTAFERYDLAEPSERPTYDALAKELDLPATTITNHLALARRELRRLVIERLETITSSRAELRAEARDLLGVDIG